MTDQNEAERGRQGSTGPTGRPDDGGSSGWPGPSGPSGPTGPDSRVETPVQRVERAFEELEVAILESSMVGGMANQGDPEAADPEVAALVSAGITIAREFVLAVVRIGSAAHVLGVMAAGLGEEVAAGEEAARASHQE